VGEKDRLLRIGANGLYCGDFRMDCVDLGGEDEELGVEYRFRIMCLEKSYQDAAQLSQ
jgi:hypothetical protein